MGDTFRKIEEAERQLAELKESSGYNEVRRQRKSYPGVFPGQYSNKGERRSFDLTSEDKAFLDYIRTGEKKALTLDTEGQYLVSPTIEAEIERSLAEEVVIRGLANKRTIDKDRLQVRSISEASVSFGRLETGTEIDESDLTPGAPTYKYACDLYGLVKLGEDEITDNDFYLVSILADSFSRAIAEKEEYAFIKGVGWDAGQEPDGIILDSTLVAAAVETAAAGAITVEDMLDLIYECPKKYRKNGAFVVHSSTELALRKLRARGGDEEGNLEGPFLWQAAVAAGMPNTFLGRPIYTCDEMEELSDTEGILAIFGDFNRGYRIIDRQGIGIQRLSELYAEAGLVGFKVHARVGGYCIRPSNKALVLLKEAAD